MEKAPTPYALGSTKQTADGRTFVKSETTNWEWSPYVASSERPTDPLTQDGELMWPDRFGPKDIKRLKANFVLYDALPRLT